MRTPSKTTLFLSALMLSSITVPAFAQQAGDVATGLFSQFSAFANVIMGVFFLAGLGVGGVAALKFKAHSENGQQVPLKIPMFYTIVAVILIAFPAFLTVGKNTLFQDGSSNSLDTGVYNDIGN